MEKLAYQGNSAQHTFHSDVAAMKAASRKSQLEAAIFSPVAIDAQKAALLMDDLKSGDETRIKSASDQISLAMRAPQDAMAGKFNPITHRNKMVNATVMPMMGRVIEVFINQFGDELEAIDDTWMSYIFTDNLDGAFKATIYDIINNVVAHRLNHPTDPIEMSKYKSSTWESILPEYYAAGVQIERYIVDGDPMSSINNIVVALRIALLKLRTTVAFERVQAAITLAIAAGYVTAYTGSSVAKTLNAAYLALIQRCQGKGYGLTANSPVVITGNEIHRSTVETIFDITTNSLINSNNGTIRVRYPLTRQYTFNLAADLGDAGEKVALVLPFRRNRVGNFRTQVIETETKISTNSQDTYAREAYNFTIDELQFQIATIA
jgi:hypothetical protein